jgi:iron complex transport system ATP-binding protein
MSPDALAVEDLVVRYGAVTALGPVSHRLPAGAWHCVVGPNGAGKSSLLRAVAGLTPFDGAVRIQDRDLQQLRSRPRARLVALVPQHPVMPAEMALRDYVLLGRSAYSRPLRQESPRDHQAVEAALERMDVAKLASRRLSELSGGERQRAILARALAQEAPVMLLDEPTTALDIGHAQQILEVIDQLRMERGLSVLATMHDLTLAAAFADRVLALDGGRSVAEGPPAEVLTEELVTRCYAATVVVAPGADGRVAVVPVRARPPSRPAGVGPGDEASPGPACSEL